MFTTNTTPIAALVLRVSTGVLFLAHALVKLLVFTPAGTAGYFQSLGLPGPLAYLVIAFELAAAAALILGVYSRYFALASVPLLLGAGILGHGSNGWSFSSEGGGWEFPVFWAFVMVAVALLDEGKYVLRTAAKPA